MKINLLIISLAACIAQPVIAQNKKDDAVKALVAMETRLTESSTLSYHYSREINNFKDNSFSKTAANCYLEFDPANPQQVKRFQIRSDDASQIYNGSEYFVLNKTDKTYSVQEKPGQRAFNNLSYFYNSLASLRSALGTVIKDDSIGKSVRDTLINQKAYQLISLRMHNKAIDYLGNFRHFTIDITIQYDLLMDKTSHLPYQIREHNDVDAGKYFTLATYTDIDQQPKQPEGLSWYYSTYKNEYHPKTKNTQTPLIAQGATLPDWALSEYNGQDTALINNTAVKGKLVLMDFWIKNCGYCMLAFPHLKALQDKYGKQNLQILAINAYEPKTEIGFFYKREQPAYKMLYNGKQLARQIGVESNGYPTAILTDGSGKVLYAGTFDSDALEKLIKANL